MDFKIVPLFIILASVGLVSNSAFAENLNLTGNLNVNDTQMTTTSNLLLSMLVTLAESILPILVGAAVGHKSMKYWQEKKNSIATKNRILTNYAQSFQRHITLLDNFVGRVFRSYVAFQKGDGQPAAAVADYSSSENNISGYLKFVSDEGQMPSARFSQDHDELVSAIDETAQSRDRLYMDIKSLHGGRPEVAERLHGMMELLKKSEIVMERFFQSTNASDFEAFYNSYRSLSTKTRSEIDKIESELVALKAG